MSIELTDITGLKDIEGFPVTVTDVGLFKVTVNGEDLERDCYAKLEDDVGHRLAVMAHKHGLPPVEMVAIGKRLGSVVRFRYLGVDAKRGEWKMQYHNCDDQEPEGWRTSHTLLAEQCTPQLEKCLEQLRKAKEKLDECRGAVDEIMPCDEVSFSFHLRGNSVRHASQAEARVATQIEAIKEKLEKESDKESTNE